MWRFRRAGAIGADAYAGRMVRGSDRGRGEIATLMNHRITGVAREQRRMARSTQRRRPKGLSISWSMRCGKDEPRSTLRPASSDRRDVVVPVSAQLLFARTARACDLPSTLVATGPFGDIKNYNGRRLVCLVVPGGAPHRVHGHGRDAERRRTIYVGEAAVVERICLGLGAIYSESARGALEGAQIVGRRRLGRGAGAAVRSRTQRHELHRRDRFGVRRSGSYISVDTGKYSTAPWLAQRIAEEVMG